MSGLPAGDDPDKKENRSGQGNAPITASAGNRSAFLRHSIDGYEKAVAATRESFDEARIFCGITQCAAQALDGGIQAVVEVHEGVRRPQLAAQLFPGDHLAGPFKKECQELERLVLELDFRAVSAEFTGTKVGFEDPEADDTVGNILWHPDGPPVRSAY